MINYNHSVWTKLPATKEQKKIRENYFSFCLDNRKIDCLQKIQDEILIRITAKLIISKCTSREFITLNYCYKYFRRVKNIMKDKKTLKILSGFLFRGLGIFIPGIGDFLKSWDFYPGDLGFLKSGDFFPGNWGFSKICEFFSRGLDIFQNLGIYIPGAWKFSKIWRFLSRELGIFENMGAKFPGFISRGLGIFWGFLS